MTHDRPVIGDGVSKRLTLKMGPRFDENLREWRDDYNYHPQRSGCP